MSEKRNKLIAENARKTCTKCNEDILIADFYWQKTKDRPMSWCKECWKARQREDYRTNPKRKEYLYKYNTRIKDESEYDRKLANMSREEWKEKLKTEKGIHATRWKTWYNKQLKKK